MSEGSQKEKYKFSQGDQYRAKTLVDQWIQDRDVTIIGHAPSKTSKRESQGGSRPEILPHSDVIEEVEPPPMSQASAGSSAASPEYRNSPSEEPAEETMTRDELKAHLEAKEARVEQMTDRVEQRLSAIDEKMDARLDQIDEIDQRMEEREEKFYAQIESTLADFRAERQSDLGDLKEHIGELSGELEGVRDSNRASFRNNRILVGVAGVVLVIVQILVTVWLT